LRDTFILFVRNTVVHFKLYYIVSFISTAAHQKFMLQCHSIISTTCENSETVIFNDKNERVIKDLIELEQLMDAYLAMLSELPKLTCKYYNLHRSVRVNIRKIQQKKSKSFRRKLKLK